MRRVSRNPAVMVAMLVGLILGFSSDVGAADKISREEVRELTLRAASLIDRLGLEEARPTLLAEGEFLHDEIYVNVIDLNGTWRLYPPARKNEGKSVLNVVDRDGKLLVQDIIRVARDQGEGWVSYRWLNPASNQIETKDTYLKLAPERGLVVYIGVYR